MSKQRGQSLAFTPGENGVDAPFRFAEPFLRGPVERRAGVDRLMLAQTLTAVLLIAFVSPAKGAPANPAQNGAATSSSHRQASLSDQLMVGLKAKTPEDRTFLNQVVQLVEQGTLPRRVVDSTFLWARSRSATRADRNPLRPMVYFRPALTLRARRLGIVL